MVIAKPIGTPKKTSEPSLIHKFLVKVEPIEQLHGNFLLLVDGMTFYQQSKGSNTTVVEFAMNIFWNPINWKYSSYSSM
jgi:hypothetical protein